MMQKRMMELQEMLIKQQQSPSAAEPTVKQQAVEPPVAKLSTQEISNHTSSPTTTQSKNGLQSEKGKVKYKELDKNPFFNDEKDVTNSRQKISNDKKQRSPSSSQTKMSYSQMASQKKQNKQDFIKTSKQTEKKPLETELFGENSDSDWDELDGDEKIKLSEEGQELKKIMKKGTKERISHANKEDVEALRKKAEIKSKSWKDKTSPPNKMLQNSGSSSTSHNTKENDLPSVTDPFSGIRIINPKVSALDMKMKMADRKLIKVSRIASKVNTADLQGNWVTIAVVVHKTEPRTSSTGKTYCIWKLSDLQDCDKTVSLFLFGEVYKQHWKNEVKTVIGLLNPNLMDKAEKVQQDLAFTVNHPQQILIMGYSKDLGKCAGVSRAGNSCTNFINRQQGDYCTYHVKAAYKKSSSTRTELQGSFSGVTPKNMEKKGRSKKDSYFFYGGETYTTQRPSSNTKKYNMTLDKLQNRQEKGRVTTLTVNDLKPDLKNKPIKDETNSNAAGTHEFADLLNIPSAGSMNFVKHLIKKEKCEKVDENADKKVKFESVSAKDLLKQHKELMKQKINSKKTSAPVVNPLSATPTLGRGFYPGGNISLDSPKLTKAKSVDYDVAKKLAIAKIRSKGGLQKDDPNSVRKKTSPQGQEKIKKRVLDSIEAKDDDIPTEEPPKKRSRLLGSLDVNSEEFKKLMSIKSKHTGALAEVEAENEARYFMELEKREKYEDKMSAIMEMKCVVFTCKQCNYTAFKTGDSCKKEGHTISKTETMKRFFKCKKCGWRIISIDKYPTQCCKECGEYAFERVAMYQERKGPKLPSEELSIRGNEMKHVGSHQKMYLNL
ncbi:hypothetical protein KUTeg_020901 [Tegillarca granosa]|uniref:Protein MCM10 homolog n=1 Tax=Tegillarca granosa TaxID=220873 RepID=A0ABQ9E997_TEGGR|nr:hypothetical protein KUTeg_020901 [Tegillarca granosa]